VGDEKRTRRKTASKVRSKNGSEKGQKESNKKVGIRKIMGQRVLRDNLR
jgi:hypothetical protein